MIKITILLLLAMFWSGTAIAVVYQCRDKAGNIFLTNDRSKFPPGCEQFGEPFGEQPPPPPATSRPATRRSEAEMNGRGRAPSPPPSPAPTTPKQLTKPEMPSPQAGSPAGSPGPDPGGAEPERPGEPKQEDDQEDEGTAETPDAPGQPN